ncbi:hypothetical protein CHRY9390_02430 [Chryseobacterium aquaeductus]|uniref:Uncharacterized protein n=1 Tax=Chryseobacterium aquaeductus TaxID=2675056 RepID=A0A9N8MJ40_9FLAO|nr:hypothetical protein [Chryseobacterium aquaeductus]CAA7331716.1 hypothetical protein CHRY9390_02430 [Chryseobacterium potabilaquae]CAD7811875.1 hypothetical protein CHRY9390_02430 [Chryseobacterium aquaeductus]
MKNILLPIALLIGLSANAQVGINNTSPNATLDISAKTTDGSKPEGLLAPRLTGDQIQAGDAQYTAAQKGVIIYATAAATSPSIKTTNITAEGYYFFDGTAWQKISGGAAAGDATNDSWVNDTTNTMVTLGTKADGTARTAGTEFVAKDNGAVGIGTASPNASALIDLTATNKGMLIPRVALTGPTDQVTIVSPATGLMVYNTGAAALTYKGFVFWNGTEWRQMDNSTTVNPVITGLNCTSAYVAPAAFTSGVPYTGILTVYYSNGNGGSYPGGTTFTQNGLTFTLDQGTLNKGNGYITYSVTGTPDFTSPSTVTVPLSFLGFSCNATIGLNTTPFVIGEIRSARITVNAASFTTNGGSRNNMTGKSIGNIATTNTRSAYEEATNSEKTKFIYINGLRMDFLESFISSDDVRARLYNTTSSTVKYDISALSTNDAYRTGVNSNVLSNYYSFRIDGDDNMSASTDAAEYVNTMLTFPNGEWYNCTWHATRDATNYYFFFTAQRLN